MQGDIELADSESAKNSDAVNRYINYSIRCPICGRLGSEKRQGFCSSHDPALPEMNVCVQCGKPAYAVRDDYEGCPKDFYCKQHYFERCGPDYEYLKGDWSPRNRPPCEQCGKPAWKMAPNNYAYCRTHWLERMTVPTEDDRYIGEPFTQSFEEKYMSNEIPGQFAIIKDKFDLEK